MCARFALTSPPSEIERLLDVPLDQPISPRYNIAPTQPVLIGTPLGWQPMIWGLIPSWANEKSIGVRMINARIETVQEKPAYRTPIRRRRAIVPATAFYEWRDVPNGTPSLFDEEDVATRKQPYEFRTDDELFAMAAIWDRWTAPDGSEVDSFSILTGEPNELLGAFHDRMPVILPADIIEIWLDHQRVPEEVLALIRPYPAEKMRSRPVNPRLNSVRNEGPDLLQP